MQTDNKVSSEDKDKCRIITPEFRVSFPHLFKPSGMRGTLPDTHKYSVTMLFDKNADLSEIKQAVKQAKVNKWGPDKKTWPEQFRDPWTGLTRTNGDAPKYADKDGYKGHWAIKASSNLDNKPGVVDRDGKTLILEPSVIYPGCYARAFVFCYVWEFPKGSGKFGVGLILEHVQKLRDGKSFAGKKPADQVFSPVSGADDNEADDDEDVEDENF